MVGINIKNVTKHFGDTIAVENVSLSIGKGELFFLLGPSGCGKTTILRMIAGFETPTSGDIHFDGRSILEMPAHKRNAALVFQNYALWPHMTVAQNVAYGLDERRVPRDEKSTRVAAVLKSVRMEGCERRMPNQLSGGQQQRVALARALVVAPDAVLLDEPLSNLDARLRLQMRREIRRIHDEIGITMVYVTHDQKESLTMADNIAVMSMGRVEQIGPPRTIYRSPANRFVADFIGEANLIKGTLTEISGAGGRVKTALGEFEARMGVEPLIPGDNVVCMIRPECLVIDAARRENAFRAKIKRNMYLGEVEQFELETDGESVHVVCANPGEEALQPGAEVRIGFAAKDAVILKAEQPTTQDAG